MRTFVRFAVLLAGLLSTPCSARPFAPDDLVSLSRVAHPVLSPDGRWLVWDQSEVDLAANRRRSDLWRLDLTRLHESPEKFASIPDADETDPAFGSNGQLYFLSDRAGGKAAVWSAAMSGGSPVQVTGNYGLGGFVLSPMGNAVLVWAVRPAGAKSLADVAPQPVENAGSARIYDQFPVRFWNAWADGQRSQLFVIPMTGGRALGPGHAIEGGLVGDVPSRPSGGRDELAWSQDGRTVYFTLREAGRAEPLSTNFDIFSAPADGSSAPLNLTTGNPAIDTHPSVSPNGRWLAWLATARPGYENDRQLVMLRDLVSGKTRAVTRQWDRSIDAIRWAADSTAIYATAQDRADHPLFRIRLDGRVDRLTKDGHVGDLTISSADGPVFAFDSLTAPTDFWRIGRGDRPVRLTAVNAARLAGVDWPTVMRFTFAGAKGDPVWALALRPPSLAAGASAPVALLVHGGPQSSFSDRWSPYMNAAAWAGHGFAVVAIDFHGSTGYGQAFTDAVNRDWGGKPLVDLKLGLKAAIENFDFIDGSRACAAGASYGGYMMNWIQSQWPDRFKCLIEDVGVFDTRAMTYETDDLRADEWDFGNKPYHEAPDEFEKWSPVHGIAKWATPTLVITGERDFRSPSTQGIATFTALQKRNVPSRLLVFPDEGHAIVKPKNSLQWYREVFRWVDRFIGEGTPPGEVAPK